MIGRKGRWVGGGGAGGGGVWDKGEANLDVANDPSKFRQSGLLRVITSHVASS
jgi:hypothetical protein